MARKVVTAPLAAEQFRAARRWLMQKGSGPNAHARWQAIKQARSDLKWSPCLWPADPEQPGARRRVVAEYRLIYRVKPDTGNDVTAGDVTVVALFGPGQP